MASAMIMVMLVGKLEGEYPYKTAQRLDYDFRYVSFFKIHETRLQHLLISCFLKQCWSWSSTWVETMRLYSFSLEIILHCSKYRMHYILYVHCLKDAENVLNWARQWDATCLKIELIKVWKCHFSDMRAHH